MKIRPKLILAEIIISLILFITTLTSISSLISFIEFEDFKIETAKLQDTVIRMKYSVIGMLSSTDPTFYLTYEYNELNSQVHERLEVITEDPLFNQLSRKNQILFIAIKDNLDSSWKTFDVDDITGYLNLRENTNNDTFESLLYLQTILRNSEDIPHSYMREIDYAVSEISSQEIAFSNIEKIIHQTLTSMLEAKEGYGRKQIIIAISVPAFTLLIAIFGILLFTNNLSRKIIRLDKSLSDIVGGDFSVRIDTKGRDEFSSLAGSINAFTRTLGAKLESFRLIMHDIGQTLTSSMDSSQVENTLLNLAMRETAADGAALYKVGGESGELIMSLSAGKFRPPFVVSDLPEAPEEEDINAILRSRIIQSGKTMLGESAIQGRGI
ncbi:MAG: methyl-accepting chemotaxis protein, partial [Spirochaetaceae bacterium]|nr:methyl-accepting chemotaxis protein [Spirochaetaceae bacterium]